MGGCRPVHGVGFSGHEFAFVAALVFLGSCRTLRPGPKSLRINGVPSGGDQANGVPASNRAAAYGHAGHCLCPGFSRMASPAGRATETRDQNQALKFGFDFPVEQGVDGLRSGHAFKQGLANGVDDRHVDAQLFGE